MAGEGGATPPPPAPPLPSYPEMIVEAIGALGPGNGSSKTAISGYINSRYGSSLPAQHNATLTGHLARMMATGELTLLGNNYFLPNYHGEQEEPCEHAPADPMRTDGHKDKDPAAADGSTGVFDATSFLVDFVDDGLIVIDNGSDEIAVPAPAPVVSADVNPVPVKRGRGRPPKPKDPSADGSSGEPASAPAVAAAAAAVPVKRGRGRPPKPKNPVAEDLAPIAASVVTADANAVPVKRGRGRPPKPKRGRGRPPKLKDPITVVTAPATSGRLSRRGRPPKKAKVTVEDPGGEPAAAPAVAADASAVPVKRGRGRPPKVRPAVVGKPSES